jgi:crotonobetainyl-CoA:carnitine CoA-transferase CaiB-like acyl-CoA transferase
VSLAERPELVWCTIAGFAAEPVRPGYDVVVQAEAGWMSITGEPSGEPMKHGIALVDVLAGRDAAIAILGALVARGRTGAGRHVTVALDTTARAALVNVAQNVLVSERHPERWGNAHANLVPYQLFHAQDRSLIVAVGSDAQWRHCAHVLDLADLAEDPTLATNAGRLAARERIVSEIGRRLATRPAAHWIERLAAAGVPCGLVRTVPGVLEESEASARTGMPPSVPGAIRLPPPRLGEHTALLRDHGWSAFRMLANSTR